jgi:uncharacterized protein YbjQ (UPF0145 family)
MRNPKEVLVTTTTNIEGYSIKQYLKPISAHVVAGTNFFSDFFASFSDVFGGRSHTYQKQLSSIYVEAIEVLKKTAYELGANCIIGLKVDLDEISGKGKSMFMITAVGTAIIVESSIISQSVVEANEKPGVLSSDGMKKLRKRGHLINQAKNSKLELDDSTWQFLSENSVYEISKEIQETIITNSNFENFSFDRIYSPLSAYLLSLTEDQRTIFLYDFLMNKKANNIQKPIYKLIADLMIFDSVKLEQYFKDPDDDTKNKALQLVVNEKQFYTNEDIKTFENMIKIIQTTFQKKGEVSKQKSMLSSKEKEVWKCLCGTTNGIDLAYCARCGKDIYGFYQSQVNPEKAISKLTENIEIIKNNVG